MASRIDDRRGIAEILSRIALVRLAGGDYEACARELEASREIFAAIGDDIGLSHVHAYLGAMYSGLENYPRARDHYLQSLELGERSGYRRGRPRVEALLADLHLRRGEFEDAVDILDRLIAAEDATGLAKRNNLVTRGHALLHLDRPEDAGDSYRRALELAGSDQGFRARTLTMLAHTHMQAGSLDLAATALAEAEAIPIAVKGWGAAVLHHLARADLLDAQGRKRAALRYLVAAAEIESQTFGSARSHFFQTQYRQVFERLFSLLFQGVAAKDDAEELAFRLLEQMRYRSFRSIVVRLPDRPPGRRDPRPEEAAAIARIEELSRRLERASEAAGWEDLRRAYAEYEDLTLRAELSAARYHLVADSRPVELPVLQASLAPDAALVQYVLAGARSFALVVTRRGLESAVLPIEAPHLETKIKLFRRLLFDDPLTAPDWRPLAAELWRLLIAPLEENGALDGIERLALVPMGFLHDLPFAALVRDAGAEAPFLIERYAVVRAPSATLWARNRERQNPEATSRNPVLAFGLRQTRDPELPPLAFAEREAEAVASVFGSEARVGNDASETALKNLAPGALRLHVAAHGISEPRLPLHSHLHLAPGGADDGNLTVREILELELEAELVSLSACGTGISRPSSRESQLEVDRIGFVEAFLHAGADSVLASLLPVSDRTTSTFMTLYYRHLRTASPAAALAATQREMLNDHRQVFRHPRAWAPFVLVR